MSRPTPLQAAYDEVIARLIEIRNGSTVQCRSLHEDDPESLDMLSELAKDSARIMDAIFHEIAYQGGFGSRSGASEYANIVTNAICGNLEWELRDRAGTLDEDRRENAAEDARDHGHQPHPFDMQREFGTLNHVQQFGRVK